MIKRTASAPSEMSGAQRDRFLRSLEPGSLFYQLFDLQPGVSFFAKDKHFRFIAANRHFYERFGLNSEAEVVGKDDFSLFPPRLAEHFRQDDEEIFRTGKGRFNIVELFFNRQGIPDWFVTNKVPLRDRKGAVVGIAGTTQRYQGGRQEPMSPYQQLDKALIYIREHFRDKISIEDLAALVHLSSRQLHRKFVEAFNSSPQAFIMKLRIQAACDALQHGDRQISEIATAFGFGDQSSFTKHFQKHMGLTPFRYLRQFQLRSGAKAREG